MSINTMGAVGFIATAAVIIVLIVTVGKNESLCKDTVSTLSRFEYKCSPGAKAEIQKFEGEKTLLLCHCSETKK